MSGLNSADRVVAELKGIVGTHYAETMGAAVFSPVVPAGGARWLMVQAITQNARYTLSLGQAPTAAIGFQLAAAAAPIIIDMGTNVTPQFIREAAGAVLQYQWLK